jgi:putative iron-dependent peroxidase
MALARHSSISGALSLESFMTLSQAAILGTPRAYSRFIELQFRAGADLKAGLRSLADTPACDEAVIGLGAGLLHRLEQKVEGLSGFPALHAGEIDVPSTQADLWLWLNGEDPGQVAHAARDWRHRLEPAFQTVRSVDGFVYDGGRDLTGYEDGTENPTGDDAALAAIAQDGGAGLDGGGSAVAARPGSFRQPGRRSARQHHWPPDQR